MTKINYKADGNETLADIAYKFYGKVDGYLELLYAENIGVSAQEKILPEGFTLIIPIENIGVTENKIEKLELW